MWKTAFKKSEVLRATSADHITSNFLKAVFHKFYLVHSWILWLIWKKGGKLGLSFQRRHQDPPQTSKTENFATLVNRYLSIVTKLFILDVSRGPSLAYVFLLLISTFVSFNNRVLASQFECSWPCGVSFTNVKYSWLDRSSQSIIL